MTQPIDLFGFLQLGLFVKLFFLVLTLFYFVFTAVVYRQISLMTHVLDSKISPLVRTIALIQIFAAGFLFILAIFLA